MGVLLTKQKKEVFEKYIMLNRICKNIRANYSDGNNIHKPTAKQIAFLEDRIKAPVLEDKDEWFLRLALTFIPPILILLLWVYVGLRI